MKLSFAAVTSAQVCALASGTKGAQKYYHKSDKMSTIWTAIGVLLFIILLIFQIFFTANAVNEHSAYFGFTLVLYRSPIIFLFLMFFGWLIITLLKRFVNSTRDVFTKDEIKQFIEMLDDCKIFGAILLISAFLAGIHHHVVLDYRCSLLSHCGIIGTKRSTSLLEVLGSMIGMIAKLPYIVLWVFYLPALTGLLVAMTPIWAAATMMLGSTHPAGSIVHRTTGSKRPDHMIERELWEIMKRQDATDDRLDGIFNQLSPLRRWMLKISYKKRAQEARRLREMVQARIQVLQEENKLAQGVHDLERQRRTGEGYRHGR